MAFYQIESPYSLVDQPNLNFTVKPESANALEQVTKMHLLKALEEKAR